MTSLKRSLTGGVLEASIPNKIFVQSTNGGKVRKIVKEVYLRQDIPCSSKLCNICQTNAPADANGNVIPFVLSDHPLGTKAHPHGHYLIPDTNAFIDAMDLFESPWAFFDVVVLQTVLEELRNRSTPLYNRLIGLTKSSDKRFYVFFNEFHLETFTARRGGESINDRNDRAIRGAAKWYKNHLREAILTQKSEKEAPAVILLSNDNENVKRAKSEGILASTLSKYVSKLENGGSLLDMISDSSARTDISKSGGELLYPEHMSISKMRTGVKAGILHQGIFNVSPYNYLEGSIKVPAFESTLIVLGRENGNRAVSGDMVVIEILPQSQWKAPSTRILDEDTVNKNDNADSQESEIVVTDQERWALQSEVRTAHENNNEGHRLQPTARVVGIIKRNWRQYVGHIDNSSSIVSKSARKQQTVFIIPMDKRVPKIRLRTRQASELMGQRILVTIDSWDRDSRYPIGHLVRSLGELETKGAETEALLLEYSVQYRPFPKAVLECLPAEGHDWKVPADKTDSDCSGRADLRDLSICSIDPPGCQDIDDALHCRPLPNGNFEVGVHIADVSHFVKPNNAMDLEASSRGTTVYLVDKRIDMLPMLLGTDLCSLKPYVERFAFSVVWEMTSEAVIVNINFTKSIIRSREALSYEQAQLRIDDQSQKDELTLGMRNLMMLAKKLRRKRMDAGALNLASPEVRVEMESETSDPVDVKPKMQLETNSLVEEFMLLANIAVAGKIYLAFPQSALLRRHPEPPKTNFEELANQLKIKKGLVLDPSSSKNLADTLNNCVDSESPFFNTLVRVMVTRCMMSAEYFVSGMQAEPAFRHYGLATEIYTHFTSPIRRYADLVAHRQLAAAIEYEAIHPTLRSKGKLEAVCRNINVRHRNAQLAGRASVEYYVGQALKGRIVDEEGFVMRVFSNGFVVFVPKFGIEGVVRLKDLAEPEPEADFDAEEYTLTTKGNIVVQVSLFQKVRVRIKDVLEQNTGKRKLKFGLLDELNGEHVRTSTR